jgi:hypothetical protein
MGQISKWVESQIKMFLIKKIKIGGGLEDRAYRFV